MKKINFFGNSLLSYFLNILLFLSIIGVLFNFYYIATLTIVLVFVQKIKNIIDKFYTATFNAEYEELLMNANMKVDSIPTAEIKLNSYKNKIMKVLENYNIALTYYDTKITNTQIIFLYQLGYTILNNGNKKYTKINDIYNIKNEIELKLNEPINIITENEKIGIAIKNPEMDVVLFEDITNDSSYTKIVRKYKDKLPFVLGVTMNDEIVTTDLTEFPHLLIAGETNSGKSNALHVLLTSLIMNKTPNEVKLLLSDFKLVELTIFENSPYLLAPIAYDLEDFQKQLQFLIMEMNKRLEIFQKNKTKNIIEFNSKQTNKLPYIVFVIEELASIMLIDDIKLKKDLEKQLAVLASKCRAVGIHIIITTQKPNKQVLTGLIKTNIPGRLALKVADDVDSQLMIGNSEATKLFGNGDAILKGGDKTVRLQVAFLDNEIQEEYLKK